jgi:aryl-alcohol dehydrogenase-like predicted oxidoreductase
VSVAGLGTGGQSRLGLNTHGDRAKSIELVRHALGIGINFIDTAPVYNDTELILGEALKDVPRSDYILATKLSWYRDGKIICSQAAIASCEQSLQRLGADCIDLMQIHGLLRPKYREVVDQLYPAMVKLREQGKIRFVGVTERPDALNSRATAGPTPDKRPQDPYADGDQHHDMLVEATKDDVWDSIMVRYGILNFTADTPVLERALEKQVGVLAMASVRHNLVTQANLEVAVSTAKADGLINPDALPNQDPLGFLVHDDVVSVVSAGYKFAAASKAVSTVLIGTGSIEHLEANVASIIGSPLPQEDDVRIRKALDGVAILG